MTQTGVCRDILLPSKSRKRQRAVLFAFRVEVQSGMNCPARWRLRLLFFVKIRGLKSVTFKPG